MFETGKDSRFFLQAPRQLAAGIRCVKDFDGHVSIEHPITRGVSDFEIECEHYELAGDLSQLQILAEAGGHPVLYTKRWGEGAVHYTTLGHDHRALRNPSHRQLLVQAVGWAMTAG